MSEFSISSPDFEEGGEIPKKFGYKIENLDPEIELHDVPAGTVATAIIMDDPDAMAAVGKVWVHWLATTNPAGELFNEGKNDFGERGYGGPAPPDKRHTYIFKVYALDDIPDVGDGFSKQELEDAMKGHILAEAKLTGTYAP